MIYFLSDFSTEPGCPPRQLAALEVWNTSATLARVQCKCAKSAVTWARTRTKLVHRTDLLNGLK